MSTKENHQPHLPNDHKQLSYDSYIDSQNNCALCGSELKIATTYQTEAPVIFEVASCPKCKIKTRAMKHSLH